MAEIDSFVIGKGFLQASDDLIEEQSYQIARGVRPLAIIGKCKADPIIMLHASTRLESIADQLTVPFVLDNGTGWADCGCAAARWVVDLYSWLVAANQSVVPPEQRERIIGLLLGYSANAISLFEDRAPRRLFDDSTVLPAREST